MAILLVRGVRIRVNWYARAVIKPVDFIAFAYRFWRLAFAPEVDVSGQI
jgi:hypothetical protein